jgi:hypothetical protein
MEYIFVEKRTSTGRLYYRWATRFIYTDRPVKSSFRRVFSHYRKDFGGQAGAKDEVRIETEESMKGAGRL